MGALWFCGSVGTRGDEVVVVHLALCLAKRYPARLFLFSKSLCSCPTACIFREVFPGPPLILCQWHVQRNWLKHLNEKVKMFDRLMCIMHHNPACGTLEEGRADVAGLVEAFYKDFAAEKRFIEYFRATWVENATNDVGETLWGIQPMLPCP